MDRPLSLGLRAGPVLTGTLPNGQSFSVQTWIPDSAKIAANGNGRILTNYDGYSSRYHGLELSLIKRMSDRWMARVGAAWNNATEHYSTNPPLDSLGNPTPLDTEPLDNGGPFTIRSSASGVGDMFIHGKWQLSANALYVLPANIELGASLFGRQGYPYPVYRDVTLGRDSSRRVLVSPDLDSIRYDDLWNLDLRVARSFMIGRSVDAVHRRPLQRDECEHSARAQPQHRFAVVWAHRAELEPAHPALRGPRRILVGFGVRRSQIVGPAQAYRTS